MVSNKKGGCSKECCFLPIGALTSKFYAFTSRSWELKFLDSFDPTNEFYIPLKLGVQDFKIKKVLPINKSVSVYSYNWVSNRTRVFFDSLSAKIAIFAPKFYGVDCSWFYILSSIARTSFLFNRVQNRYVLDSANYDLFSISKISSFNAKFGLKSDFSFVKLAKVKNFSNIFSRLVELSNAQSLKFLKTLELNYNSALELEQSITKTFSHIFVVGYNPYFFNPTVSSRLRNGAEQGRFSIYTFLCSNFPLSFKLANSFPSTKSLESFFSGRHYTNKFLGSSSALILDYNFILRFDSKLWVTFKAFLERNPCISIYICGLEGLNISQFINFLVFRFASNFIDFPLNFWFKRVNYFFGSLSVEVSDVLTKRTPNMSMGPAIKPFSSDSSITSVFKDLNISLLDIKSPGLPTFNESGHEVAVLPVSRFLEFESYFRADLFSKVIVNQKIFPYSVAGTRWLGSVFYGLESRIFDCSRYFFKPQVYYMWCLLILFVLGFDFSLIKGFSNSTPRLQFECFNGFSKFVETYYRENSYVVEFFDCSCPGLRDQKFMGGGFVKMSRFRPFYSVSERVGFVSDSRGSKFLSVVESKYFYNFSNFRLNFLSFGKLLLILLIE